MGELHKEWTEAGVKASRATTHRRVKEFGYSCRQRRLTWAKEKKNWNVAQWSKVLFSDESKFCISFGNQGPSVWRKGGEAHSTSCLKSSVKFPQSVMIWGAMSSAGVGPFRKRLSLSLGPKRAWRVMNGSTHPPSRQQAAVGWSLVKGSTHAPSAKLGKRAPHTQTPPRSATGQVPAFHLAALPQVRRWSRLNGVWVPGSQCCQLFSMESN